jgi:hypothetical protein
VRWNKDLERELRVYRELSHLQGTAIPCCYGRSDDDASRLTHIFEDVGSSLSALCDELATDPQGGQAVCDALSRQLEKLHAAGWSHGNIALSNVCVQRHPTIDQATPAGSAEISTAAHHLGRLDVRLVGLSWARKCVPGDGRAAGDVLDLDSICDALGGRSSYAAATSRGSQAS